MGYEQSSYSNIILSCLKTIRPTHQVNNIQGNVQALGWSVIADKNDTLFYRDGGSFGFASAVAFDPRARIG